LLAVGLLPIAPEPPLRSGTYLQNVTTDGAVVARIDPAPRQLGIWVREGDRNVFEHGEPSAQRRHAFAITGLRPGSAYNWTMADLATGDLVDEGVFATAPERDDAPVRFCAVGDSGHVPWWGWLQRLPLFHLPARWGWLPPSRQVAAIGRGLRQQAPDLWFHVGDVVYPRGEHRHWDVAFFRPFAEVLRTAPVYAVLGNHDAEHDGGRPLLANLVQPANDVTGDERLWSFAWGPVRFVGLDLLQPLHAGHPAVRFAARELAAAAEPWLVVIGHYPPFSASRQGDRQDLIEQLWPLLVAHGVDLMLCGNDHNYQAFHADGEPLVVVTGGGGKSLYELRDHPRLRRALSVFEFVTVDVVRTKLTLRVIGTDGRVLDELVLDKAAQVQAGTLRLDTASPRHRRIQALLPG
jgi:acid phosphatase